MRSKVGHRTFLVLYFLPFFFNEYAVCQDANVLAKNIKCRQNKAHAANQQDPVNDGKLHVLTRCHDELLFASGDVRRIINNTIIKRGNNLCLCYITINKRMLTCLSMPRMDGMPFFFSLFPSSPVGCYHVSACQLIAFLVSPSIPLRLYQMIFYSSIPTAIYPMANRWGKFQ